MNLLKHTNLIVLSCTIVLISGCVRHEDVRVLPIPKLEQLKPFRATVEAISTNNFLHNGKFVAVIHLRPENGEKFDLGGDDTNTDDQIAGFARTLQTGNSYVFPDTWLSYKAQLNVNTNEQKRVAH